MHTVDKQLVCLLWAVRSFSNNKQGVIHILINFICLPWYPRIQPGQFLNEVTSSAIVGLNAFLNSFNLPMNGLGGLLWKFFWQIGLLTPCSEVRIPYKADFYIIYGVIVLF